jgi:hypothetical protein
MDMEAVLEESGELEFNSSLNLVDDGGTGKTIFMESLLSVDF